MSTEGNKALIKNIIAYLQSEKFNRLFDVSMIPRDLFDCDASRLQIILREIKEQISYNQDRLYAMENIERFMVSDYYVTNSVPVNYREMKYSQLNQLIAKLSSNIPKDVIAEYFPTREWWLFQ